jgi:hypothetical protein
MKLRAPDVQEGDQMNYASRQAFRFVPGTMIIDDTSRPFGYPSNTVPP